MDHKNGSHEWMMKSCVSFHLKQRPVTGTRRRACVCHFLFLLSDRKSLLQIKTFDQTGSRSAVMQFKPVSCGKIHSCLEQSRQTGASAAERRSRRPRMNFWSHSNVIGGWKFSFLSCCTGRHEKKQLGDCVVTWTKHRKENTIWLDV